MTFVGTCSIDLCRDDVGAIIMSMRLTPNERRVMSKVLARARAIRKRNAGKSKRKK